MPTPPVPKITTVSPGRTSAARVEEQNPVVTPADQRGQLERDVILDLDAGPFGDDGTLGERAEDAHAAEVFLAVVEPEGAVDQAADGRVLTGVAQVLVAGRAVPAGAADGDVGAGHPVASFYSCDAGAGLFDHAGALVAADEREARGAGGADVLVGMAQARRLVPDEDLAGLGLVQV
jgi:hypothetical protein